MVKKASPAHVSVVQLTATGMAEEAEEGEGDVGDCLLAPGPVQTVHRSSAHLILLTCGLGGLQVVWSVILSNGSPYLVSLGLSRSLTALIWIAAPVCGCIVQPPVGAWSDHSTSRWGRRRPFIFFGTIGIVTSLILLAWVREIVGSWASKPDSEPSGKAVVAVAVILIYILNAAIQPVQAGIRSLIIDTLSVQQQAQASTYVTIMQGLGNILGYLFGFLVLPSIADPNTSLFQRLSIFASVVLCITIGLTCSTCSERQLPALSSACHVEWTSFFKRSISVYRQMPATVRKVCHVQFFSWMAWFPFLYYSTTYVAEHYTGKMELRNSFGDYKLRSSDIDIAILEAKMSNEGVRVGTFASFLFSTVTFLYNMILPRITASVQLPNKASKGNGRPRDCRIGVVQAWKWAHVYFFLLMLSTLFVHHASQAVAVVALAGLSWALTLFAPFAIIGTELAAKSAREEDVSVGEDGTLSYSQDDDTGAVMGIHNVAISLPQIFAALVCSGIYAINNALNSSDGTGWVLKAGGVAALIAALLCKRLEED